MQYGGMLLALGRVDDAERGVLQRARARAELRPRRGRARADRRRQGALRTLRCAPPGRSRAAPLAAVRDPADRCAEAIRACREAREPTGSSMRSSASLRRTAFAPNCRPPSTTSIGECGSPMPLHALEPPTRPPRASPRRMRCVGALPRRDIAPGPGSGRASRGRLGTKDALFSFHRGMIERCLGHGADAQTSFREALRIDPNLLAALGRSCQEARGMRRVALGVADARCRARSDPRHGAGCVGAPTRQLHRSTTLRASTSRGTRSTSGLRSISRRSRRSRRARPSADRATQHPLRGSSS